MFTTLKYTHTSAAWLHLIWYLPRRHQGHAVPWYISRLLNQLPISLSPLNCSPRAALLRHIVLRLISVARIDASQVDLRLSHVHDCLSAFATTNYTNSGVPPLSLPSSKLVLRFFVCLHDVCQLFISHRPYIPNCTAIHTYIKSLALAYANIDILRTRFNVS